MYRMNIITVTAHSMNMTMILMMRSRHDEKVTTTTNTSSRGYRRIIMKEEVRELPTLMVITNN